MPTQLSMIRTINRQIEDYRRRLGTESEEYENLLAGLADTIGRAQYNKKDLPFYSRSKGRKYDQDELEQAYKLVTGKNTAARIEQEYIKQLEEEHGTKFITSENVKRYIKIRNKAFTYYSDLYNYLQTIYEDEYGEGTWRDSDLRSEYYKRGAATDLPEDTPFWLDAEITKLTGENTLKGIESALDALHAFDSQQKKQAKEKASNTRSSGRRSPKEFGGNLF